MMSSIQDCDEFSSIEMTRLGGGSLTQSEAVEVEARLQSTRLQHDKLDAEIKELEVQLHNLRQARASLGQQSFHYRAALSTIRRMPVEIWRLIFALVVSEPMGILPAHTEPRLTITHTCNFWRKVALDMAELWTDYTIVLTQHVYEGRTRPKCLALMEAVFPRAQGLKLSLTTPSTTSPGSVLPLYLIPDLLVPYGDRFDSLDIYLSSYQFESVILDSFEDISFRSARRLSLRLARAVDHNWSHDRTLDTEGCSVSLMNICPDVEHLTFILPAQIESITVPWSNLKTLNLQLEQCDSFEDLDSMSRVFAQLEKLEKLTYYVSDSFAVQEAVYPDHVPSPLPSLRCLEITTTELASVHSFLQFLSFPQKLPALESVRLKLPVFDLSEDEASLRNWGVDIYIEKFTILEQYQGDRRDILEFIQKYPKLKEMDINLYPTITPDTEASEIEEGLTNFLEALMEAQEANNSAEAGSKHPLSYVKIAFPIYHLKVKHDDLARRLEDSGLAVDIDDKISLGIFN